MKISNKDQRGIAHLMLIVLVVVVVAVIGLVGWKVFSKNNNNKTSNSAGTSSGNQALASQAQSACMSTYHDTDLCKFVAAEAAHPYDQTSSAVTMTVTQNGTTSTMTLNSDGKGNNSATLPDGSGGTINSVTYGGHTYVQLQPGGAYIDEGASASSNTATTSDSTLKSLMADLASVKYTKIGQETCGNLTCLKYQISDNLDPSATQYAWFDTTSYLMREYKTTGGSSGDIDMKIAYQPVTITKPTNVQSINSITGQ